MGCARKCNPKLTLKPGELRSRIQIQQKTATSDGGGGYKGEAWTTIATVRASITPLTGRGELFMTGQMTTTQLYKIRLRYFPGLTTAYRVKWDGRIGNVREVLDIDYRHFVHELTVEEGESNG